MAQEDVNGFATGAPSAATGLMTETHESPAASSALSPALQRDATNSPAGHFAQALRLQMLLRCALRSFNLGPDQSRSFAVFLLPGVLCAVFCIKHTTEMPLQVQVSNTQSYL